MYTKQLNLHGDGVVGGLVAVVGGRVAIVGVGVVGGFSSVGVQQKCLNKLKNWMRIIVYVLT